MDRETRADAFATGELVLIDPPENARDLEEPRFCGLRGRVVDGGEMYVCVRLETPRVRPDLAGFNRDVWCHPESLVRQEVPS